MSDLIITNGESTAASLAEVMDDATIVSWDDFLHEGPVTPTESLSALSDLRSAYIAKALNIEETDIRDSFTERDDMLDQTDDFDTVQLWFEHDVYDQLQLIQLLSELEMRDCNDTLFLVQADDFMGRQEPDELGRYSSVAEAVGPEHFARASLAWNAFRTSTPEAIDAFLKQPATCLPFLSSALKRLMEELPSVQNGLTRTEHQILTAIDEEALPAGGVFARATALEQGGEFLGDSVFFMILDRLIQCQTPLIEGIDAPYIGMSFETLIEKANTAPLHLSEAGQAIVKGEADMISLNGIDRHWGGTHLTTAACWRYDRESQTLVTPKRH